jgi:serine/threonine-protein phosphatase 5
MEAAKAHANKAFAGGHYGEADVLYTEALSLLSHVLAPPHQDYVGALTPAVLSDEEEELADDPASAGNDPLFVNGTLNGDRNDPEEARAKAILLSNRALTRIRLEQYGFAINDANEAIALDPTYIKSFHRRATGYFALGDVKKARKDFKEIVRRVPTDVGARAKLAQCEKVIREERFAKAIQADDGQNVRPACESIDPNDIVVEENYNGPRIAENGVVDAEFVSALIDGYRNQKKLHLKYAVMLVLQAKALFDDLPNVVDVAVPSGTKITVCGDVHGQYYDLADSIFKENGTPSKENPYVFNGDFVDRGSFSVEVIFTLLSIKVACPEAIYLTRGNHESQNMNKIYGFEGEVKAKYSREIVFRLFTELFRSLPLAYVLDGTVDGTPDGRRAFVVHGGLFSRDGVTLKEIQAIDRRQEPDEGLLAEMLWSDPQDANGWGPSKRGIGVAFGPDVTHRFLDANGLDIIVRSHEMKEEGYEIGADGRLITIFSAPNYCDQMGNKGAYIHFDYRMQPKITQVCVPSFLCHPARTGFGHLRFLTFNSFSPVTFFPSTPVFCSSTPGR